MFAALPLIASFILLFVVFLRVGGDWRKSFLSAAILWGLSLTAITEILSLLNSFTFPWVEISWLVVVLLLCMIVASLRKKIPNPFLEIPNSLIGLLAGISCIFFMVGLIALTAPPNTWDSMTYHMSRVAHWVQNGNVSFYPTHILRQLYQPPWAEFAIAHLQVLSGGDRFANLIQWFSMVGCALGVSLIARQLGAKLQGQVFAAVFCATIPMGILQGSSTQNDYVVSFWLVCFVYFLMTFKANRQWTDLLAGSASLGLAILTKGTAYIYASPFLVWYFWTGIKELRWSLWKPIVIIPVFVLLINLGHYQRNMSLFGSPIASTDVTFNNEIFTLKAFISNLSRNLSLHLGTFGPINAVLENGIVKLHAFINTDINDTRTTWPREKFHVRRLLPHEDLSGNPAHLFLIAVSVVLFLISKKQKSSDGLAGYLIAVTTAFLLFVSYLKWQPWHSRLHLPIFVLFSAFSGLLFLCAAYPVSGRRKQ